MPHIGLIANWYIPASVSLNGMENPVRRSRSRLPPVMLSTVSIINLDAGFFRALHHRAVETAIPVIVELIDLRRIMRLAQFLQTDRAERGYAEHRTVLRRCGCNGAFARVVEKALQRGGRTIERHGELLTHDGYGHVGGFHAAQDIGHQVTALEARGVLAIGHFVVSRAIDVIEDWTGQPSLGQPPE